MGKWVTAGAVLVIAVSIALPTRANVIFADDFSVGLRPSFWKVQKNSNYTVDDTQGDVRISTGKPGSSIYRVAQVYFTPQVVGDFDMRINFHDAQINLQDFAGQAANQLALHAQFDNQHFASTRDIAVVEGNNYHVYLNPPGQTVGVKPTTLLAGELRVVRTGNAYAGYFNGDKIYEANYANPNPSALWFSLENNQTNDATSVIYDNFSINAQDILGIPEPAGAAIAGALGVIGLAARTRRRRAVVA